MNENKRNVCDIPLQNDQDDQLEVSKYSKGLIKFIENCQTPMTISIQGEWGSGKTSLINKLEDSLQNKFDTYIINTWDYALIDQEDISMAILKDFLKLISSDKDNNTISKSAGKIFKSFLKVGTRAIVSKYSEGMDIGEEAFNNFINLPSLSDIKNDIKSLINKKYEKPNQSKDMLFFIDDLDRLNPIDAIKILELLKNLFDQPHCIFVLAIDYDVVVKGLKAKFDSDEKNDREYRQFFDKIVQLPFSMPINNYSLKSYLKKLLVDEINFLNEDNNEFTDYMKYLEPITISTIGKNPRALKRVVNYLSLIKSIIETGNDTEEKKIEDKIVQYALLCIQVAYPEIYTFLSKNSNFKEWGTSDYTIEMFESKEKVNETIFNDEYFNEEWEQTLYCYINSLNNKYLIEKARDISRVLNILKDFIEEYRSDEIFSEIMDEMIQLSSITNATNVNKYQETINYQKIWEQIHSKINDINKDKITRYSNKIKLINGYIEYVIKLNKSSTEIDMSYVKKGGTLHKDKFLKLEELQNATKKSDKQICIKVDTVFDDDNFVDILVNTIDNIQEKLN